MGNRFDSINRITTYYIMSARDKFQEMDTKVEDATRDFLKKLQDEEDERRGKKRTAEAPAPDPENEKKRKAVKAVKEELKAVGARSVTPVVKDGKKLVKITSVKEMATPKKEQAIVKPRSTQANKNLSYDLHDDVNAFLGAYFPECHDGDDGDNEINEINTKISEETNEGRTTLSVRWDMPELSDEEEKALLDELRKAEQSIKAKAQKLINLDDFPEDELDFGGDKSPLGMDMSEPLPYTIKHKSILRF